MSLGSPVGGRPGAGSVVGGCELVRVIGEGGAGQVWLAREPESGEWRAVKVVARADGMDATSFEREVHGWEQFEAVAQGHPAMVRVFEWGVAPGGGWLWAVMELADPLTAECGMRNAELGGGNGISVAEGFESESYRPRTLANEITARGRLPVAEVLDLALPVLEALGALHRAKRVHRDIKPANLLYVQGRLKLADPGLLTEAQAARSVVGTREFVPLHGAGTPGGDLYGLGKVLYVAATGRLASDVAQLPTLGLPVAEITAFLELQEILFQACAEEPSRRYVSADAMRRDVQRVRAGESLRQVIQFRRRARQFGVTAAVALALTAVVAWGWQHEARRNRELARLALDNRERLIQLFKANADHAEAEGAYGLAALWLAEALRPATDTNEVWRLRYRISALRQLTPRLVAVGAHAGPINEAEFSPDGRSFMTVSEDGTAARWDAATGRELGPRLRHEAAVNTGQFSRDGGRIVTGCTDGVVSVWDTDSGRRMHRFAHGGEVLMTGFDPDGGRVVSAGRDGFVRVWDLATGREAFPAIRHEKDINVAVFSPDGRWLLTASKDQTAQLWQASNGVAAGPVFRHEDDVRYAAFSPDSRRVATAGSDGVAQVWEVDSGRPAGPPIRHVPLYFVAFSPDGRRLVTAGGRSGSVGEARVWDATTGAAISPPLLHAGRVRHAAFSPDGRWVATAGQDGSVRLHDLVVNADSNIKLPHGAFVWSVSFSPDGRQLLTAGQERVWRLWDLEAMHEGLVEFRSADAGVKDIGPIGLTPDGSRVVAEFGESRYAVWSVATGQRLPGFPGPAGAANRITMSDTGFCLTAESGGRRVWECDAKTWAPSGREWTVEQPIAWIFLSPDARHAVTSFEVTNPSFSTLVDLTATPPRTKTLTHRYPLAAVAFSSDGRWLATTAGLPDMPKECEVRLWSLATGEPAWPPIMLPGGSVSICFSPDDRFLATGLPALPANTPVEYRVFDVATGRPTGGGMPHPDGVDTAAFAPNGLVLATGGVDGGVRLWRIPGGEPLGPVMRHALGVSGLAWSPDGRVLVSSSADHTVRLWDVHSGEPLAPPSFHEGRVVFIRLADHGRIVLSDTEHNGVRLWRLPIPSADGLEELVRTMNRETGLMIDGGRVEILEAPATAQKISGTQAKDRAAP